MHSFEGVVTLCNEWLKQPPGSFPEHQKQFNRFWRGRFNILRDLADEETRSAGINLVYENECVLFTTSLTRTFFQDRDLEPTDAITFKLTLKTLGEVSTGFSQSQNAN